MYISRFILCSDQVYTRTLCICIHDRVHTCSNIVHTMYIPSIHIECTSSTFHVHRIQSKMLLVSGFEFTTLCRPLSCLNHCASSVSVIGAIVLVYMYCCTVRLSGAGPAAPPAPAMTSPGRASTWISFKPRSMAKQARAQATLEALMWLRYSGQMAREEEPAT